MLMYIFHVISTYMWYDSIYHTLRTTLGMLANLSLISGERDPEPFKLTDFKLSPIYFNSITTKLSSIIPLILRESDSSFAEQLRRNKVNVLDDR